MLSLIWTSGPPGVRWEAKPEHWALPLGNLTSNQSAGTAGLKLTPTGREQVSDRGHSLAEYTGLEKSEQVCLSFPACEVWPRAYHGPTSGQHLPPALHQSSGFGHSPL